MEVCPTPFPSITQSSKNSTRKPSNNTIDITHIPNHYDQHSIHLPNKANKHYHHQQNVHNTKAFQPPREQHLLQA
jgi:hypothetical protein